MPKQKIVIPMSQEDLEDLMNGDSFNWSFPDQNGVWIDVKIINQEESEE